MERPRALTFHRSGFQKPDDQSDGKKAGDNKTETEQEKKTETTSDENNEEKTETKKDSGDTSEEPDKTGTEDVVKRKPSTDSVKGKSSVEEPKTENVFKAAMNQFSPELAAALAGPAKSRTVAAALGAPVGQIVRPTASGHPTTVRHLAGGLPVRAPPGAQIHITQGGNVLISRPPQLIYRPTLPPHLMVRPNIPPGSTGPIIDEIELSDDSEEELENELAKERERNILEAEARKRAAIAAMHEGGDEIFDVSDEEDFEEFDEDDEEFDELMGDDEEGFILQGNESGGYRLASPAAISAAQRQMGVNRTVSDPGLGGISLSHFENQQEEEKRKILEVVYKDERWYCPLCQKSFTLKFTLQRHLQGGSHPQDDPEVIEWLGKIKGKLGPSGKRGRGPAKPKGVDGSPARSGSGVERGRGGPRGRPRGVSRGRGRGSGRGLMGMSGVMPPNQARSVRGGQHGFMQARGARGAGQMGQASLLKQNQATVAPQAKQIPHGQMHQAVGQHPVSTVQSKAATVQAPATSTQSKPEVPSLPIKSLPETDALVVCLVCGNHISKKNAERHMIRNHPEVPIPSGEPEQNQDSGESQDNVAANQGTEPGEVMMEGQIQGHSIDEAEFEGQMLEEGDVQGQMLEEGEVPPDDPDMLLEGHLVGEDMGEQGMAANEMMEGMHAIPEPSSEAQEPLFEKVGNEFHCLQCDKCMKSKKSILRHIDVVHNMIRYNCMLCRKNYQSKQAVENHLKQLHGLENPEDLGMNYYVGSSHAQPVTNEFVESSSTVLIPPGTDEVSTDGAEDWTKIQPPIDEGGDSMAMLEEPMEVASTSDIAQSTVEILLENEMEDAGVHGEEGAPSQPLGIQGPGGQAHGHMTPPRGNAPHASSPRGRKPSAGGSPEWKSKRDMKVPCTVCKKLLTAGNMKRHMSNVHKNLPQNLPHCEECGASFPTSDDLEQHLVAVHHYMPSSEMEGAEIQGAEVTGSEVIENIEGHDGQEQS